MTKLSFSFVFHLCTSLSLSSFRCTFGTRLLVKSGEQTNEKSTEADWKCELLTAFEVVKNVEIRNFRSDSKLSTLGSDGCESRQKVCDLYVRYTATARTLSEPLIGQDEIANEGLDSDNRLCGCTIEYFNKFAEAAIETMHLRDSIIFISKA